MSPLMVLVLQGFFPLQTLDEYEEELEHAIGLSWMRDFHERLTVPSLRN